MNRIRPLVAPLLALGLTAVATAQAPTGLPDAKTIVEGGLNAMGGRAALEAISTSKALMEMDLPLGQGQMVADMSWSKNGDVALTQTAQGSTSRMGVTGDVAWVHNPAAGGYRLVPEAVGRQIRNQAGMATGLLRIANEYPRMTTVEQTDFDGRPCWKIALGEQKDGVNSGRVTQQHAFFDVSTKLIAGLEYTENMNVGPVSVRIVYSDWKPVGKTKHFHTIRMSRAALEAVMRVKSLELNTVPKEAFELPEEVRALAAGGTTTAPTTQPVRR